MNIKNVIIYFLVFLLILWMQHNDDIKYQNFKRVSLYDKFKIPLVCTMLVILVKNFNYTECAKVVQSFLILRPSNKSLTEYNNKVFSNMYSGQPTF